MGNLKIASDFIDFAMNLERLNMWWGVGEMMGISYIRAYNI